MCARGERSSMCVRSEGSSICVLEVRGHLYVC